MRRFCVLKANMAGLEQSLTMQIDEQSQVQYYRLEFQVVMSFKRAKLQAKLVWKENVRDTTTPARYLHLTVDLQGQTREGPVTILPESTF
jgi:hypothetical protein